VVPPAPRDRGAERAARRARLAGRGATPDAGSVRTLQPLQLPAYALRRAGCVRHRSALGRRGRGDGGARLYAHRRRILAREFAPARRRHALPLDVVDRPPDRRHVRPRCRLGQHPRQLRLGPARYRVRNRAGDRAQSQRPASRCAHPQGLDLPVGWPARLAAPLPLGVVRTRPTGRTLAAARVGLRGIPLHGAALGCCRHRHLGFRTWLGRSGRQPAAADPAARQAAGHPEDAQAADGGSARTAQRAGKPAAGWHHLHCRPHSARRSMCASTSAT
jgi:hypothetical protein